jgi:hypothetical protein
MGRMPRGLVIRCSDDERERCAVALRLHYEAGRLDHDELEERVGRAYRATTRTDLALLLRDLPPLPTIASLTAPTRSAFARAVDRLDRVVLRAHATAFGVTNGSFVAIWAVAGAGSTFWPGWLLVPWAPFMAWHAASSWTVRRLVARVPARRITAG